MRVFKYRGGGPEIQRRDIRSLSKNQLYAAGFESLNDLFEARVEIDGESFRVARLLSSLGLGKYGEGAKRAESAFIQALTDFAAHSSKFGVYSLSTSATDELLWAHYANAHTGFCLEFELDELLTYKLENQGVFTVKYQKEVPVVRLADLNHLDVKHSPLLQKFIGTKSKRWEYEGEMRVVTGQTGLFEYDFRALKAIYFGARSTPHMRRLVMRIMAGRGLRYFHVLPHDKGYSLRPDALEDAYSNAKPYRSRVAPVDEGVPYLSADMEEHRPMLEGAIEISRREPYCERVTDAYLSSRGTPDNPVYYVTYERSDGLPRNFFISKKEILAKANA
jgi:hypothetical protein